MKKETLMIFLIMLIIISPFFIHQDEVIEKKPCTPFAFNSYEEFLESGFTYYFGIRYNCSPCECENLSKG